jgi:hypothetical protein
MRRNLLSYIKSIFNNNKLFAAIVVLFFVAVVGGVTFAVANNESKPQQRVIAKTETVTQVAANETETPYNVETFREAFFANCVISAKSALNETAAKAYCGCVLDRGTEVHGIKRFIEINQEAAMTYDLSALKSVIDECVAGTITTQSRAVTPEVTVNSQDSTNSEPVTYPHTYNMESDYDISGVGNLTVTNQP